jgi:hypothetical protein
VLPAIVRDRRPDVDLVLGEAAVVVASDLSLFGPGVEQFPPLGWHPVLLFERAPGGPASVRTGQPGAELDEALGRVDCIAAVRATLVSGYSTDGWSAPRR